jgi:hypothetical protein
LGRSAIEKTGKFYNIITYCLIFSVAFSYLCGPTRPCRSLTEEILRISVVCMQLSIADLCAVDPTGGSKGISRSLLGMLHVFFNSDSHLSVHSFYGSNISSFPLYLSLEVEVHLKVVRCMYLSNGFALTGAAYKNHTVVRVRFFHETLNYVLLYYNEERFNNICSLYIRASAKKPITFCSFTK